MEELNQHPFFITFDVASLAPNDDLWLFSTVSQQWLKATSTCNNKTSTRVGTKLIVPICHLTQFALFREDSGSAAQIAEESAKKRSNSGIIAAAVVVPIVVVSALVIVGVLLYKRRQSKQHMMHDEDEKNEMTITDFELELANK